MTQTFALTRDLISLVQEWKRVLLDPKQQDWSRRVTEALSEARKVFVLAKFQEGGSLTGEQWDQVFKCMRVLSWNQALNRLIYENNGLERFNQVTRKLLCGTGPLPDRLDEFFELEGVGLAVTSHLLTIWDNSEYPLITRQTYEVIGFGRDQWASVDKRILSEWSLSDPEQVDERTLRFLRYLAYYRAVKEALGLQRYAEVNMTLIHAYHEINDEEPDEEAEEPSFGSVTLERDLRDYISKHPEKLAKGLALFDQEHPVEYPTEVGPIDILLKDPEGVPVVVETKKGRASDRVVGQTLRYMGWLKSQGHKRVRGIIVAHERDEKLDTALLVVPDVKVIYYAVRFEFATEPIASPAQ